MGKNTIKIKILKKFLKGNFKIVRETFEWVQPHRSHRRQAAGDNAQNGDDEPCQPQKGLICPVPFYY